MKVIIPYQEPDAVKADDEDFVSESSPFLERDAYLPRYSRPDYSKKWVAEHLPRSKVADVHGEKLYYVVDKNLAYYFMVHEGLVVYAVRVKVTDVGGLRVVCQTSLWRNKEHGPTTSVASYVFFKRLLPQYGVIISDKTQSTDGKGFWIRRCVEALKLGLFVYKFDQTFSRIPTIQQLDGSKFGATQTKTSKMYG